MLLMLMIVLVGIWGIIKNEGYKSEAAVDVPL